MDRWTRRAASSFGLFVLVGLTAGPLPAATAQPRVVVQPGSCVNDGPGDPANATANFVFSSGGTHYLGMAGHAVLALGADETVWSPGAGPAVYECDSGERIGEWAYAVYSGDTSALLDPTAVHEDFGLVRLDPDVQADPAVKHWGGPTGVFAETTSTPTIVYQYGDPYFDATVGLDPRLPEEARPRVGVAPELSDPWRFGYKGVAGPGDSGSPVIAADGRALGFVVKLAPVLMAREPDDVVYGLRLGPMTELAEDALGIDLELETAPLGS